MRGLGRMCKVLTVALVLASSAAPTAADSWTVEPEKSRLVKSATIDNPDGPVTLTIKVKRVKRGRTDSMSWSVDTTPDYGGEEFIAVWDRWSGAHLLQNEGEGAFVDVACDGFASAWLGDRRSRTFTLPQECISGFTDGAPTAIRARGSVLVTKKTADGGRRCLYASIPRNGFSPWVSHGDPDARARAGAPTSAVLRRGC